MALMVWVTVKNLYHIIRMTERTSERLIKKYIGRNCQTVGENPCFVIKAYTVKKHVQLTSNLHSTVSESTIFIVEVATWNFV